MLREVTFSEPNTQDGDHGGIIKISGLEPGWCEYSKDGVKRPPFESCDYDTNIVNHLFFKGIEKAISIPTTHEFESTFGDIKNLFDTYKIQHNLSMNAFHKARARAQQQQQQAFGYDSYPAQAAAFPGLMGGAQAHQQQQQQQQQRFLPSMRQQQQQQQQQQQSYRQYQSRGPVSGSDGYQKSFQHSLQPQQQQQQQFAQKPQHHMPVYQGQRGGQESKQWQPTARPQHDAPLRTSYDRSMYDHFTQQQHQPRHTTADPFSSGAQQQQQQPQAQPQQQATDPRQHGYNRWTEQPPPPPPQQQPPPPPPQFVQDSFPQTRQAPLLDMPGQTPPQPAAAAAAAATAAAAPLPSQRAPLPSTHEQAAAAPAAQPAAFPAAQQDSVRLPTHPPSPPPPPAMRCVGMDLGSALDLDFGLVIPEEAALLSLIEERPRKNLPR